MEIPVACSLTPDQLRDRKASLLPGLAARAVSIVPLAEGYTLTFSAAEPDIVSAVGGCLDAERHCCPFLRFSLTVSAQAGLIELTVTGPTGTRAFLDALIS